MIRTAYGDDALSRTTMHTWFKEGRHLTEENGVKTMLIAFFDSKGLMHHENVPFGQTVNATFYLSVARICRVRLEYHEPGS